MFLWKKLTPAQIKAQVFTALAQNVNYFEENILGIPASHLDSRVFNSDASFLKDAPYISTLLHNPNHIGCHTLGKSEHFFKGTQVIEKEVIEICAAEILRGAPGQQDGYVASGGTEANMQAVWVYRNLFLQQYGASLSEICILCTEDTHYSISKAANVLQVDKITIPVQDHNRSISEELLYQLVHNAQQNGKKYYIVIANMMTTMFGSVDDADLYTRVLQKLGCHYYMHTDGAYGGFFYPFSEKNNKLDFSNPNITSITLDAHKMAQAPYGTGIFLIRKGLIQYANTKDASYVEGEDYTLIGSRSGANAVAIWMILMNYGPFDWREKIHILQERANWLCERLQELGIQFYRHPASNIVTIRAPFVSPEIANLFGLVPDNHHHPQWYKIVIMEHVHIENLLPLVEQLKMTSA